MAEAAAGGQEAEGTQGQGPQGTETAETDTFDKDRALSTIKAQRESEKALKAQLADLQSKLTAHESEKLSETEKLQKRVSDMEAAQAAWQSERQELVLRSSVTDEARRAGALRPDAVWKLIEFGDAAYDEAGRPSNTADLVAAVRKEYPELFGASGRGGSADGGARGGSSTKKTTMNDYLRGAPLPSA